MAKGLRSKVKKRNRAVMRSTVGKAFQQKKLAETVGRMKARTNVSTSSSSSLLAVGALLGGGRPLQERTVGDDAMADDDEDDAEEGDEDGEGNEGSSDKLAATPAVQVKNVGINAVPGRVARRGTKNMRKYGVKQVVHVYRGAKSGDGTAAPRRVGRSLPGSGKRRSGKPKALAEA